MRYLVTVIDDTTGSATDDEIAAIDEFNERLRDGGHWVVAGGLAAPDTATVVDHRGDEPVLVDGPFLASTEFASGFWIIETDERDTALALAIDGSKSCHRKVELRPFLGS